MSINICENFHSFNSSIKKNIQGFRSHSLIWIDYGIVKLASSTEKTTKTYSFSQIFSLWIHKSFLCLIYHFRLICLFFLFHISKKKRNESMVVVNRGQKISHLMVLIITNETAVNEKNSMKSEKNAKLNWLERKLNANQNFDFHWTHIHAHTHMHIYCICIFQLLLLYKNMNWLSSWMKIDYIHSYYKIIYSNIHEQKYLRNITTHTEKTLVNYIEFDANNII